MFVNDSKFEAAATIYFSRYFLGFFLSFMCFCQFVLGETCVYSPLLTLQRIIVCLDIGSNCDVKLLNKLYWSIAIT